MYKPINGYDFKSVPTDIEIVELTDEIRDQYNEHWNKGKDNFGIAINGQLLGRCRTYMDQCELVPELFAYETREEAQEAVNQFMRLEDPYPYQVCEFSYNGFFGKSDDDVIMPYRARFVGWTGDPGIAVMQCSDGERRRIPTYAMKYSFETLPNDVTEERYLFGAPSKS